MQMFPLLHVPAITIEEKKEKHLLQSESSLQQIAFALYFEFSAKRIYY